MVEWNNIMVVRIHHSTTYLLDLQAPPSSSEMEGSDRVAISSRKQIGSQERVPEVYQKLVLHVTESPDLSALAADSELCVCPKTFLHHHNSPRR